MWKTKLFVREDKGQRKGPHTVDYDRDNDYDSIISHNPLPLISFLPT